MTSNDELFRALVEHPYGMAAAELNVQRARAQFFMQERYMSAKKRSALLTHLLTLIEISLDLEAARARARGRA